VLEGVRAAVRRRLARRLRVPEIPVALANLKDQGYLPDTIFDVGAYHGEFARECLKLWPDARIACFEPLPHVLPVLDALAARHREIAVHGVMLGASEAEAVTLNCAETASSALREHHQSHPTMRCRQTTVDAVVAQYYGGQSPDLLKIDVQGYELEVLKGAEHALAGIGVVLAELNFIDIHRGAPLMADVVAWLAQRRFTAFDFCGMWRRPLDNALWQADLMFVPADSPLRADKRWA
jgi:FkbM family methyltransferase